MQGGKTTTGSMENHRRGERSSDGCYGSGYKSAPAEFGFVDRKNMSVSLTRSVGQMNVGFAVGKERGWRSRRYLAGGRHGVLKNGWVRVKKIDPRLSNIGR